MSKRYIESYPSVDDFPLGEPDGTQAWDEANSTMYFMGNGAWQAFAGGESLFNTVTFDSVKTVDALNLPETYTNIATLVTPERAEGEYMLSLSGTYSFDRTTESVFIRFRVDGGAWNEGVSEPKDVSDIARFFYQYPAFYAQGIHTIEVEARKESTQGTLDFLFLDVYFQRVN